MEKNDQTHEMAFLDVVNPSLGEDDLGESAEDLSEDEELELNKPDLPFRYNLVYINSLFKFFSLSTVECPLGLAICIGFSDLNRVDENWQLNPTGTVP